MNAFIYDPQGASGYNNSTLVLKDGKVDLQANKDGWREGLAYLNSLYKEGLIDKGAFTQNPDALTQQGDGGKVPMLGSTTVLHLGEAISIGLPDGRDKQYDAVPPLTGPKGVNHAGYNFPSAPGATFVLTNKATPKEQIQAIKLLDYIFTDEGQINGLFGTEGKGLDEARARGRRARQVAGADVQADPAEARRDSAELRVGSDGAVQQHREVPELRGDRDRHLHPGMASNDGCSRPPSSTRARRTRRRSTRSGRCGSNRRMASEVATLQTNIENYVQQNALQFITGSKNIDTEWDAYVKGLDGLGLERFLEIQQAAYDKVPK